MEIKKNDKNNYYLAKVRMKLYKWGYKIYYIFTISYIT